MKAIVCAAALLFVLPACVEDGEFIEDQIEADQQALSSGSVERWYEIWLDVYQPDGRVFCGGDCVEGHDFTFKIKYKYTSSGTLAEGTIAYPYCCKGQELAIHNPKCCDYGEGCSKECSAQYPRCRTVNLWFNPRANMCTHNPPQGTFIDIIWNRKAMVGTTIGTTTYWPTFEYKVFEASLSEQCGKDEATLKYSSKTVSVSSLICDGHAHLYEWKYSGAQCGWALLDRWYKCG